MTYTEGVIVAVGVAVLVDSLVLRTRLIRQLGFWVSYAIVLVFQFVVNGVLTGRDVVRYDPHRIIGIRLFHAPVEDIGFGFALVLLTLSVWSAAGRRGVGRPPTGGPATAGPTVPPPADGDGASRPPAG